jgi:TatD DNase family protein
MAFLDTHAHLQDTDFDADRDAVIERARQAGVEAILCVGITLATSRQAVELAAAHENVFATVGIHPNSCGEAGPDDWAEILRLLDQPRVVGLGETGLDCYWDETPLELQREYFRRHLAAARQLDLPVIIHCRDAETEMMPELITAAAEGPLRGVMHAFSDTASTAAAYLELGLHISFAGNVTYTNRKFQSLRAAAVVIPADRLLLETDAPYLVPEPFRGRQKRNEPAWVAHTAAGVAGLRGVSLEELGTQCSANARQLFRLP